MKQPVFTGAAVAIITPMHADGTVNVEELGRIIDDQIAHGTDAIVICGTTGESAALSHEEHVECIRFAVKHTAKRVPVIAGTGSNDTAFAIRSAKQAKNLGADALLLVTGVNLQPATLAELAKLPNVNAVKEASGNISQVADVAALCGEELNIYSGNDDQIVPILSLGGKGVISVLSNVAPQQAHDICAAWFSGDTAKSLELQLKALPLCHALFADVNPIPVKWAMNRLGWNAGPLRLPLVEPSAAVQQSLENEMKAYGVLK